MGLAALVRPPALDLPQCHLAAGCLVQTAWNIRCGLEPEWNIRDLDVFYFDADLCWDAEDAAIRRASTLFADLGATVEVRNQARVHLRYEQRFGSPCPQLLPARNGIDRFLVACTAVGIQPGTGEVHAPFELNDLAGGVLRINLRHPQPRTFLAKANDYRARWPWLTILEPG